MATPETKSCTIVSADIAGSIHRHATATPGAIAANCTLVTQHRDGAATVVPASSVRRPVAPDPAGGLSASA